MRVRRHLSRLGVMLLASLAVLLGTSLPAWAHHPEITASVECQGRVTFRVISWEGTPDDPATPQDELVGSRSNDRVEVSYSTDGGRTFEPVAYRPAFRFDEDNDYRFTGEFALPAPLPDTVVLSADTPGPWANGAIGEPRSTVPLRVPDCAGAAGSTDGRAAGSTDGQAGGSRDGQAGDPAAAPGTDGSAGPVEQLRAVLTDPGPGPLIAAALISVGLLVAALWTVRRLSRT